MLAATLCGCGGDDPPVEGPVAGPPSPAPVTPVEPPTFVGAVYAGTDNVGNNSGFDILGNYVVA